MAVELRLPNINGLTEREQLTQIRSYLYQLIPQLQWALNNTAPSSNVTTPTVVQAPVSSVSRAIDPQTSFDSLKALIIKSADIVEAYYEEINRRLQGIYVGQSDFGTYTEQTEQEIIANSTSVKNLYKDIQTITSDIENLEYTLIESNAHINSGLLYYSDGIPVYGVEVGQKNIVNGEEVFNKYARFTSGRLSFYDRNDIEVAYISDYKLYITNAEILGNLKLGGYVFDTSNGLALQWVKGG